MAPSNAFPSEVLHAIFSQAWETCGPDISLVEKDALRSTVLSCAQVCQHWRLAARDLSCGWAYAIDYRKNSPAVVADFLKLSIPHPLDVGHRSAPFRIRTERDLAVLNLLKSEIPRIREWNVEVASIPGQSITSTSWILPSDQPAIVTLRVRGDFPSSLWDLRKLCNSLRTLSIHGSRLLFPLYPSMQFGTLTELSVGAIEEDITLTVVEWLDVLRGTSSLQFLSIHCAIQRHSGTQIHLPVHLPHLRVLSLREKCWSNMYSMRRLFGVLLLGLPRECGLELWFPSTAQFRQRTADLEGHMAAFAVLLEFHWGAHFAALGVTHVPQVELAVHAVSGGARFSLGTVYNPRVTLNWGGERGGSGVREYLDQYRAAGYQFPPFNIIFDNPAIMDFKCAIIVTEILVLERATKMRIHLDAMSRQAYSQNPDVLVHILSYMPQVTHLLLHREDVSLVMAELYAPPSFYSDSNAGSEPILPKLQAIVLDVNTTSG